MTTKITPKKLYFANAYRKRNSSRQAISVTAPAKLYGSFFYLPADAVDIFTYRVYNFLILIKENFQ